MFVAINNEELNIHNIDKWMNDTRKANDGVISPEFAMEILTKTNHLAHIKKVLSNIKEKCDTHEKIAPYREFILSCVDEREMSGEALKMLQEMATLCGCDDELKTINEQPKLYGKFDCGGITVSSDEGLKQHVGCDVIYVNDVYVDVRYHDLSRFRMIKFLDGSDVTLSENSALPRVIDASMCDVIRLNDCDLTKLKMLKFKEDSTVALGISVDSDNPKSLPKFLDVSMCRFVYLRGRDLGDVECLKFRDGSIADLTQTTNLPKDLDVSMCGSVLLSCCDLEGLDLKFKEGAFVNLKGANNLPHDLDVSMCASVDFSKCDLSQIKEIKFKEGAKVILCDVKEYPEILDLSGCKTLTMTESDFKQCKWNGAKVLKFKNKKQMKDIGISLDCFDGEVIFTEESNNKAWSISNLFSKNM